MKYILTILTITIFGLLGGIQVEAFDLFEPDRGKPPPSPSPPPPPKPKIVSTSKSKSKSPSKPLTSPFLKARKLPPPRPRKPKKLLPQKDFMLVGTSQIGEKRAVILKGPDNKEFIQRFEKNIRTPIKGYDNRYILVDVKAREVQIEYPQDSPCRKDRPKKGLTCSEDQKLATLKLERRKALAPKRKPVVTPKPPRRQTARDRKREQERKKRKKLYKNFKRQVIKDEDVPPGMRVVRTPFGDRLVPLK